MTTPRVIKSLFQMCKLLARTFWLAFLFIALIEKIAVAQPVKSKALKLVIQAATQSVRAGEEFEIEVALRDANDQAVPAAKDMIVEINARAISDSVVMTATVTIKAGSSAEKLRIALPEAGIVYIWAKHNELLTGGIDFLVKKPIAKPDSLLPSEEVPPPIMEMPRAPSAALTQPRPIITLRYSPQRPFLADGKDQALIQAFLLNADEISGTEIRLRLFNSAGEMAPPPPLVIQPGSDIGASTLTSNKIQTVKVELLSTTPVADVQGQKEFNISFAPAITQLDLKASPPVITLVDKAELLVRLLDQDNNPVATDEPRLISLAIDAGRGEIESKELTIEPNKFEARTVFLPTWRGEVVISASTPNLPITTFPLKVTLPLLTLVLTAVGGLAGGLIAFWTGKTSKWWRIAIGLITGFVLYWAFVFGVLTVLPRTVVLNPLSAFVLSTLGGWLGTEVFAQILKRFGLTALRQATPRR
ncbi:MAG: hypothetical protein ACRENG_03810 [bacterium]